MFGVASLPEIHPGDDLTVLFIGALASAGGSLEQDDAVVFTSKVVSKAEGRLVRLDTIDPSPFAQAWATRFNKDPRQVEVVLRECRRVVRMDRGLIIGETHHGFVCANAGVDVSNAGASGQCVLLPADPDASARRLRAELFNSTGMRVAVLISDTFGRPWRVGQTNVAIGAAGMPSLRRYAGATDPDGYELRATEIAVVDELAAAAELVMGKLDRVPVAVIRGAAYTPSEDGDPDAGVATLIRDASADLFR